jgi:DNA-binding LytR/AlgR family response regulator
MMTAHGILIVEDEFIIAQNLRQVLTDLGYTVSGHAFDAQEALDLLQQGLTSLVLVDIRLGQGMDGIDLVHRIRKDFSLPCVFLTSHSDRGTISRAKEAHPAGFLVKPFNREEIFATIEIALANVAETERNDYLFLKVGSYLKKVAYRDITFLKADRVYVEFHRKDAPPLIVRESLNAWEEKLPADFVRVHRSYIVHLPHVEALATATVTVAGVEIPISRQVRDEIEGRVRT